MMLTPRDRDLLRLLRATRWLTTCQIHRRFFGSSTTDAASKRLRILTDARYLFQHRPHRMAEALYTLGREGKRILESEHASEVELERKPPKQLEHFLGINDIRISAEMAAPLAYFFAYWELPALAWRQPIIPDAVFCAQQRTYAVEFDRGAETLNYFMATKIRLYEGGLSGFPLSALIIVTDREPRLRSLAKAAGRIRLPLFLTTLESIRARGIGNAIFLCHPDKEGSALW